LPEFRPIQPVLTVTGQPIGNVVTQQILPLAPELTAGKTVGKGKQSLFIYTKNRPVKNKFRCQDAINIAIFMVVFFWNLGFFGSLFHNFHLYYIIFCWS
jgi:hypothetical protein